ncbi:unnamed protein product [Effrenium voratum]|nr:unnamed protein product [Effrenium voratum]
MRCSASLWCQSRRWAGSALPGLLAEAEALAKGSSLHGFAVEVGPSSISPSAGNGVYVSQAQVPEGALVALYAGLWFPSVPMAAASLGNEIYSWARILEAHGPEAVDARLAGCKVEDLDGFRARERVSSAGAASSFAMGQLVNHPPKGRRANVQILQLEESLGPLAASEVHRGTWYLDPSTGSAVSIPASMLAPTIALQAASAPNMVQPREKLTPEQIAAAGQRRRDRALGAAAPGARRWTPSAAQKRSDLMEANAPRAASSGPSAAEARRRRKDGKCADQLALAASFAEQQQAMSRKLTELEGQVQSASSALLQKADRSEIEELLSAAAEAAAEGISGSIQDTSLPGAGLEGAPLPSAQHSEVGPPAKLECSDTAIPELDQNQGGLSLYDAPAQSERVMAQSTPSEGSLTTPRMKGSASAPSSQLTSSIASSLNRARSGNLGRGYQSATLTGLPPYPAKGPRVSKTGWR